MQITFGKLRSQVRKKGKGKLCPLDRNIMKCLARAGFLFSANRLLGLIYFVHVKEYEKGKVLPQIVFSSSLVILKGLKK